MQARSFIASTGLDTNNGKLATPCRSIGPALAQTDPGGEIIVLDSAGYGPAVINKSVSIIAPPGVFAGISVTAGAGIDVTTGIVTLRGITIQGAGGAIGVHVGNATVHIDRCVISGVAQFGIHADVANGTVHVRDTQVSQCSEGLRFDGNVRFALERVITDGNASAGLNAMNGARGSAKDLTSGRNGGPGVNVQNGTAGTDTYVSLDGAMIVGNGGVGLGAGIPAPVVARANVAITRSTIADNGGDGILVSTQGSGAAIAEISDVVVDANAGRGVAAIGAGGIAVVCGNRVTRNVAFGLAQSGGGAVKSEQDNMVDSNNMGGPQTNGPLTAIPSM